MSMDSSWDVSVAWAVAGALLLFWAVGAYNRLVRLRSAALQAFALLESQWLRHLAWIEVHALPMGPNPADTPLPAMWAQVWPAAEQFRSCLQQTHLKPLDAQRLAALSAAWTVWRMAKGQALVALQAETEQVPLLLAAQWEPLERQDQQAVEAFNVTLQAYNAAIRQFPAVLLAWIFSFRAASSL